MKSRRAVHGFGTQRGLTTVGVAGVIVGLVAGGARAEAPEANGTAPAKPRVSAAPSAPTSAAPHASASPSAAPRASTPHDPKDDVPSEPLWPTGAPGALGTGDEDQPRVDIYLPAKDRAVGTAVVVCPGGGYVTLALDHEGRAVARWLNGLGITAFVLHYRHGPRYHHPVPLGDAHRALRWVRARAKSFGVDSTRVGIWGFSAGGHLASTTATHFDRGQPRAADPIDRQSARPDFLVLSYAVITMAGPSAHTFSRKMLLGDNPDPALVASLSNETQVTSDTPPTFLFQTDADTGVPAENSVAFYLALRKAKVPAELHIYQRGPHGVGLAPDDPITGDWPRRLADWFWLRGLLRPSK